VAALVCAPVASAQVQPYGTNDFGGFRNVLPPGTSGFDDIAQLAAWETGQQRPPHNSDQLAMYSNLTTAAPNIQPSQIGDYFKDATFGVPSGDVQSSESPEPGVTIVRDSQYGVPHIYGETRAELEFGIGYATAEDRLFFIDALRHAGDGTLASFAGGANAAMDESVWASEPYTQQDLANQVQYGLTHSQYGPQIFSDATNYVAGINAYITRAKDPLFTTTTLPAEYVALGKLPEPFSLEDLVSIATLVGGIFGNGGGDQLANATLYEDLYKRFGREHRNIAGSPEQVPHPKAHASQIAEIEQAAAARARHEPSKGQHSAKKRHRTKHHKAHKRGRHHKHKKKTRGLRDRAGFSTLLSFVDPHDPEAPTTVHGKSFRYQTLPRPSKAERKTIALPDPGSVQYVSHVVAGALPTGKLELPIGSVASAHPSASRSKTETAKTSPMGDALGPSANAGPGLLSFPKSMSNALLISAKHSTTGHPLAVMGPQVAYFAPEILMEEDIHGPGIDADGAAFPGTNLYVQLGHGTDYAWSATSAGQNIIDTFAVPLCNPSGGKVSTASNDYMLAGHCVPMETLTDSESWAPNVADTTAAGSMTLQSQRTAYGIVIARATIHGTPVAYTNLRSTYMHELDSVVGFYLLNDPSKIRNPQDFMNAADQIQYTFNWFYTDDQHIAYFNSGLNPVRAPHTDPLFPSWSTAAWQGLHPAALTTPASLTEADTPQRAHPQTTDQSYLTSWNNKQAPGYNDTATAQQFSSVFRSQLLDNNIHHYLAVDHGKMTLTDLINAMGNAGTQDLRGVEVLPYALKLIGSPKDPQLATAVGELRTWVDMGAHRINREAPGASGNYDQSDAVRIMDAWWPLLIKAEFQPVLGSQLLNEIEHEFPTNDEPGHGTSGAHLGSSWDVGFYGIVQKDLRAALGKKVKGPLNRIYCGGGSRARCRAALESSLRQAIGESSQTVYPADGVCAAGDQMCSDSIQFRAIGAITQPLIEWVNRPTFQQADMILGHGPR
jgi:acyl-homoserine lactone acylase PvdQ